MKSNTVVRINNKLMNKGITFSKNSRFEDIIQAWSFLTCFILDIAEGKNETFLIDDEIKEECKEHFIQLLEEWIDVANYRSALSEILEIPDE